MWLEKIDVLWRPGRNNHTGLKHPPEYTELIDLYFFVVCVNPHPYSKPFNVLERQIQRQKREENQEDKLAVVLKG